MGTAGGAAAGAADTSRRARGRQPAQRVAGVVYTALYTACAAAGLVACGGGGDGPPPVTAPAEPPTRAPDAHAYLTAVLDTMQRHSVNRYTLDWPAIRAAAFATAGAATSAAETYAAIDGAVQALGDHHSHFYRPGTSPSAADPAPTPANIPSGRLLDARTAYVFVPYFLGANPYGRADSTLAVVRALDAQAGPAGPCGWVVDLRLNRGGNLYPMVAGLGPLLGDGRAGAFVDPDGTRTYWYYRAGAAGMTAGATEYPVVTLVPYALRRATPPAVAVLYGAQTASSGEATAISFRGLPNARSFGTPTAGLTTANQGYPFGDGAVLNLTVSVEADRTGRLYGGALTPDVTTAADTPDPSSGAVDPTMQAATQWLAAQPACTNSTTRAARVASRPPGLTPGR